MQFNKVTENIIKQLEAILGKANVVVDEEKMEMYSRDETSDKLWEKMPEVVIKPENAEQIAEVVKLANRELIPITPRGGGSGLAAGAVPLHGGMVLSLEKMNKILEIDKENLFMVLEPGVTTGEVQKEAKELNLFYAGDPCSAESSFIGGNVATNAGGNKAIKYGVTGRHVYGLEVVMPDGEIVVYGGKNVKDVTFYDMVHLMVGSEGTLGIITKIWLKLMPLPQYVADLLVPFPDMQSAIDRDEHAWHDLKDAVLAEIYDAVYALEGNLSGEHGIGAKRISAMYKHMTEGQKKVLRTVKEAFDPNNIMNPGKVVLLGTIAES
ncbi:MAG: D-lactate dehydrogenase (cytochrome) [Firmicutes bacterium]|nr:D-lactate dehydrogenase (cytochrome) [Bacillota bacterium]